MRKFVFRGRWKILINSWRPGGRGGQGGLTANLLNEEVYWDLRPISLRRRLYIWGWMGRWEFVIAQCLSSVAVLGSSLCIHKLEKVELRPEHLTTDSISLCSSSGRANRGRELVCGMRVLGDFCAGRKKEKSKWRNVSPQHTTISKFQ